MAKADAVFLVVPSLDLYRPGPGPDAPMTAAVSPRALDGPIRDRLGGYEIEFLEGIGAWNVRAPGGATADGLRQKLADLPVDVADDTRFFAG